MNLKFLILAFTILLTFTTTGQSLKIEPIKTTSIDSSSLIRWQCRAGSITISKHTYPLVIINGRRFKNCLLQNIFFDFDTTAISTLHVLNPKNDSIRFYGKEGQNGIIIIITKKLVEWISSKQILKQRANDIFGSRSTTLIKVGNLFFDTDEELYFQKNIIKNISIINNTTQYYLNRQFDSIITIEIAKKSDT